MRILMVTSEAVPYAKAGGLADAVSALSAQLSAIGHDVRVVLPRYYFIDRFGLDDLAIPLRVPLGSDELWCGVYRRSDRGPQYYFLDYEALFGRDGIYGTRDEPSFPDNARRFALLGRGALELCRTIDWIPDVIHCHDWPAVPAILYAKSSLCPKKLQAVSTVFTIHNLGHQGEFEVADVVYLGLTPADLAASAIARRGRLNFLSAAIELADKITTVSPGYAKEIRTPEFGFGLEKSIKRRADDLIGIVNGIDYTEWNPETDPHIAVRYSADSLHKKEANKRALLEETGLRYSRDIPVVGMVSRLVEQKGFADLCGPASKTLYNMCADLDVQFVILGTGEQWCEIDLRRLQAKLLNLRAILTFDNGLAHRIEAGADFFLMPSRYEPCGLNQLYSMRYGTIPIVTATGGLRDTVDPYEPDSGGGTGFFVNGTGGRSIYAAVERAVAVFHDRPEHIRLMRMDGMKTRFSWHKSAQQYVRTYRDASFRSSRSSR